MYYNKTKKAPEIYFNSEKGILNVEGNCFDSETTDRLGKLYDEINSSNIKRLICNFKINIISSVNHKKIFIILIYLSELYNKDIPIIINWTYNKDDLSMQEMGEDFNDLIDISINVFEE